MNGEYPKLENMIRSYFNQDAVYEVGSTDKKQIIDLYLSEVSQEGVRQVLGEIGRLLEYNATADLNAYFSEHFRGYLDITPVDDFFQLLNSKFLSKYPVRRFIPQYLRVGITRVYANGKVTFHPGRRNRIQNYSGGLNAQVFGQVAAAASGTGKKGINSSTRRLARRQLIKGQIIAAIGDSDFFAKGKSKGKVKS